MSITQTVQQILNAEADAIRAIAVTPAIEQAVTLIGKCRGKLFTTGIGKAGYVAQKAASTFCTTGTPSVFIHPADASHGDVGVAAEGDILLTFSNSGRTREVIETVHFCRHLNVKSVISICAAKDTPLGVESDVVIELGHIKEACPLGLTPSSSAVAMIAIADALALAAMTERGFTKEDWAVRHHGGYLGKKSRE